MSKQTETKRGAAAFINAPEEQPQDVRNISVPADAPLREFLKDIAWYRQTTQKDLILDILHEYMETNNAEYQRIVNFRKKGK